MKTAVIGLGRMGLRHVTVVRQSGLDLAGVCDAREEARAAACGQFDLAAEAAFADAADMIERLRPELLVVATTAPSHAALVELAARSGARAILCEKPMATSLADCDRMIAACRTSGARLAVNHQMRFMEQYAEPKALVGSEAFGGLSSILVSAGNFGMAMNGTHYFEMFRYMTDEAPREVAAWFSPDRLANPRGAEFEDAAGSVRLATPSGRRFYMDCSADQGHGMFVTYNCRNGRIDVDELAGTMTLTAREAEHRAMPTTRYGMPYAVERRQIAPADAVAPTRAVLDALIAGANYPTGEDGRLAMELLLGAHASHARGGATIDLDAEPVDSDRRLPIA